MTLKIKQWICSKTFWQEIAIKPECRLTIHKEHQAKLN